jgi:8-oxo-dGTP diphosphatase
MKNVIQKYQFAVIATDVVIFTIQDDKLKVLLIQMKKEPYQSYYAVPGGLISPDESVDDSSKRHLEVKTGISNVYLEQLYTFGEVDRDPFGRVVSVAYFALVPSEKVKLQTTAEYGEVGWFEINNLPKLAYDHKKIIKYAVDRLKAKLEYSNVVYGLLSKEFSLGQLQNVYEIILNKKIDKRNFRKKILSLNLVEKTDKKTLGEAHRPADLYRFISRLFKNIEIM